MTRLDFRLPSLGADMESATLVDWLKKLGDKVHRGEVVASVETEKGIIDIECYEDGEIQDFVVQPGTKVPVGTVLAHLNVETRAGSGTGAPPPAAREAAVVPASAPAAAAAGALSAPARPSLPTGVSRAPIPLPTPPTREHVGRARISPAARRRAAELDVPIDALEHVAAGGIIHIEDVERWAAQRSRATAEAPSGTPQAPIAAAAEARRAMRTAIGHAMARSKREIPHYYLAHEIDFDRAQKWLTAYNERLPVKERLLEAVLIIKAVALAAAATEGFNGYFREGRFERSPAVHVGSAIAVRGGGLVAPALLDADRKDLPGLMRDLSELVTRVRAGHIRSGEFSAATITVTSLGGEGVDVLYPIINPPQVAIVGAGTVRERPWVHEGGLVVRPVLTIALAGDHRVTDGRAGARFLRTIAERLASPDTL